LVKNVLFIHEPKGAIVFDIDNLLQIPYNNLPAFGYFFMFCKKGLCELQNWRVFFQNLLNAQGFRVIINETKRRQRAKHLKLDCKMPQLSGNTIKANFCKMLTAIMHLA